MSPVGAEPPNPRQQLLWRRASRWTVLLSFFGILGVLGTSVRLPLLVLEPGPAFDVAERTRIDAPTFDSEGSIHLTTAQVSDPLGATAFEVILAIVDADRLLYSRESIFPSDRSAEHTESIQAAQMTYSELSAAVAALSELGLPYEPGGAFVTEVDSPGPASSSLVAGDIITALDSRPVHRLEELTERLGELDAGDTVQLEVRRRSRTLRFPARIVEPSSPEGSALGAKLVQYNKPPIGVSISSTDIGGPSAGLMYALSIYDRLVPEDITGGRIIAGTGTIDNGGRRSGVVGAVGSVQLKVKGADRIGAGVFIVPKAELDQAREAAGSDMQVIGVATLAEAIAELKKLPPTRVAQKSA